jgi:ABC-type multidrug transport system fused ATPase/permease subunit
MVSNDDAVMADSQLFSKILRTTDARGLEAKKDSDEASKKQGRSQVMNLLTIDTGAIASLAIHIWHVTNALVNLVIGFWLLYSMLGLSAIIGIGCIPILSSFTAILAKFIYCKSMTARQMLI